MKTKSIEGATLTLNDIKAGVSVWRIRHRILDFSTGTKYDCGGINAAKRMSRRLQQGGQRVRRCL